MWMKHLLCVFGSDWAYAKCALFFFVLGSFPGKENAFVNIFVIICLREWSIKRWSTIHVSSLHNSYLIRNSFDIYF